MYVCSKLFLNCTTNCLSIVKLYYCNDETFNRLALITCITGCILYCKYCFSFMHKATCVHLETRLAVREAPIMPRLQVNAIT